MSARLGALLGLFPVHPFWLLRGAGVRLLRVAEVLILLWSRWGGVARSRRLQSAVFSIMAGFCSWASRSDRQPTPTDSITNSPLQSGLNLYTTTRSTPKICRSSWVAVRKIVFKSTVERMVSITRTIARSRFVCCSNWITDSKVINFRASSVATWYNTPIKPLLQDPSLRLRSVTPLRLSVTPMFWLHCWTTSKPQTFPSRTIGTLRLALTWYLLKSCCW